ncbi:UvrB/UvrC motif-containing protein [Halanaerocella petrolearia]
MLCQECQEQEARIHVTKIINGEKRELYLCQECAEETEEFDLSFDFSFDNLLTGLLNDKLNSQPKIDISKTDFECSVCGQSYTEFARSGRLGCSSCYDSFQNKLDKILRRIHSSTKHSGKIPKRAGERVRVRRKIKELKQEMDEVVDREEFERAAEIRDEIQELEDKIEE